MLRFMSNCNYMRLWGYISSRWDILCFISVLQFFMETVYIKYNLQQKLLGIAQYVCSLLQKEKLQFSAEHIMITV